MRDCMLLVEITQQQLCWFLLKTNWNVENVQGEMASLGTIEEEYVEYINFLKGRFAGRKYWEVVLVIELEYLRKEERIAVTHRHIIYK